MYRMGWGGVARYCGVVVRVVAIQGSHETAVATAVATRVRREYQKWACFNLSMLAT